MKNFEVTDKETGKKYWISRSIAVLAKVVVTDEPNGPQTRFVKEGEPLKEGERIVDGGFTSVSTDWKGETLYWVENTNYVKNKYVLVNKRGEGTPNFQGCWNIPVGYLDYDESLKEACTREVMEEQGVYIDKNRWGIYLPIDDMVLSGDSKQNVTIRFQANLTMEEYKKAVEMGNAKKAQYSGEQNETEDAILMPLTKENIESREWAFNHRTLLELEMEKPIYIV